VVVNISSDTSVGIVGKAHESGGGVSACDGACVHSSKHHACGFEEADRGVDSQEFTGGAGAESVCVIHTKSVGYPIETMARELGQFICAIGGGGKGLLELIICLSVIAAYSEAAVFNIHIFRGVLGGAYGQCGGAMLKGI
jgi:hypothetical protein